ESECVDGPAARRAARSCVSAMGVYSLLEQRAEGDHQRARRDNRRKGELQRLVSEATLLDLCRWFLRVGAEWQDLAALLFSDEGRIAIRLCGYLGQLERRWQFDYFMRHHHHDGEQAVSRDSSSHACHPG